MKCTHDLRFAVLAALPLPCVTTRAHDDPAVTMIDFTNASSASWFHGNLGSQLAEVPGDEPSSADDFNVAERQKRNAVLAEPGFARSGRVRRGSGNVAGTKYPITGSVGSHTEDISRAGGGRSKAYDVIDLRGPQCGNLEGRSLGPPGLCDGQAPELHARIAWAPTPPRVSVVGRATRIRWISNEPPCTGCIGKRRIHEWRPGRPDGG